MKQKKKEKEEEEKTYKIIILKNGNQNVRRGKECREKFPDSTIDIRELKFRAVASKLKHPDCHFISMLFSSPLPIINAKIEAQKLPRFLDLRRAR